MSVYVVAGRLQLGVVGSGFGRAGPVDAQAVQQPGAGLPVQPLQSPFRYGGGVPGRQVRDALTRGDHAQTGILLGEPLEQGLEGRVLDLPGQGPRRVLKRLEPVEDQQAARPRHQFRQPASLVPSGRIALSQVRVTKESERLGQKGFGRSAAGLAGPLAVEAPVEDSFRAAPFLLGHPRHPGHHQ